MSDDRDLLTTIDAFYAAANQERSWDDALIALSDLFDGSGAMIGAAPRPDELHLAAMARLDENLLSVMAERYSSIETNPVAKQIVQSPVGARFEMRTLMGAKDFRR